MAAGNHPIKVICKIIQSKPLKIFPLKKKDNQGNKTAIKIIYNEYFRLNKIEYLSLCHILWKRKSKIQINMSKFDGYAFFFQLA